jgi:fructosamine-3-kinase
LSERIVSQGVEAALGQRLTSARPMGGGCVGEVYRATLSDGSTVVAKVDRTGGEAKLPLEGYMLGYLAEHSRLPVPELYHASDELLIMEYVEGGGGRSGRIERDAAELLADLHGVTVTEFGHERDTLIGGLDQPNPFTASWVEFFREHRLLYMAHEANRAGNLPDEDLRRVERIAGRLEDYLEEPESAALIHGDVWGGNVIAGETGISGFLDPAIYHADPEIELAFITLFGTFGETFFERYGEIRPIRDGFFEARRDLYNLYPLLTHVRLFDGKYLEATRSTLSRFGA